MIRKKFFLTLFILLSFNLICLSDNSSGRKNELKFELNLEDPFTIRLINLANKVSVVNFTDIITVQFENQSLSKYSKSIKKFYSKTEFGKSFIYNISFSNNSIDLKIKIIKPTNLQNSLIINSLIKNKSRDNIYVKKINYLTGIISENNFKNFGSSQLYGFIPYSSPEREDWILPIVRGMKRTNFQGNDYDDYGGGLPILDIWGKNFGVAVSSISAKQELIYLPINYTDSLITFELIDSTGFVLAPGDEKELVPVALIYHYGDFFNAIKIYSSLLEKSGISFNGNYSSDRFLPEWCAWGYKRNFSKEQILSTLDLVKSLNIKWVTIDDGWQKAYGDFEVSEKKFSSEEEWKAFIDSLHYHGFKVRLWWTPLMASDSSYYFKNNFNENESEWSLQSEIALKHPEWFMLNEDGKRYFVSWWNSYLLCPAVDSVVDYFKNFVIKAIKDWKIDGFKLDGQHLNSFPLCFNKQHHHKSPLQSVWSLSKFFREISNTAKKYNPDFLIQLCPCGTNYSVYNLAFIDQVVASDPTSSKQVRIKGKAFKALFGNKISYSGDHIELTNRKWDEKLNRFIVFDQEDFLSTIAVGGILSTKFTSPKFSQLDTSLILTEEKYIRWKKWFDLFDTLKLYQGEYLNFYDMAFDVPETHLIKKDNKFYYAFFSDGIYNGKIEFRGLNKKSNYLIYDLIEEKELGVLKGSNPEINLNFNKQAFIELSEVKNEK
jgi:alpha-galactosidase